MIANWPLPRGHGAFSLALIVIGFGAVMSSAAAPSSAAPTSSLAAPGAATPSGAAPGSSVPAPVGSAIASPIPQWVLDDTWTEVRAPHVTVITNAGARVGIGLAKRLELFGAALAAAFPALRPFPALPTDVYAFRTPAMLDQFRPEEVENVFGHSAAAPLRNVILLSAGSEEDLDRNRALCEQYVHVFVAANFADLPLWLDVGLAQYLGTFRPMGPSFEVGHRRAAAMDWLERNEWADLDLLFAATADARAYQMDNPLRRTLFAQAWVLTRWLTTHRAADFDRFIASMRQGVRARTAFETRFPRAGWPALMDRVRRYARDDFLDVRSIRYAPATGEVAARALGAGEALLRLGELVQDLGKESAVATRGYYQASLARDSSRARAWARLGLVEDTAGDTARAERAYRRAFERATDDPIPYLLAGMGAVARARRIASQPGADARAVDAWLATGRERLSRCLQLAPDHPQALAAFGASFVDEATIPPVAVRALERAAADLPSRKDVAANLGRLRARERVVASAAPAPDASAPSAPRASPSTPPTADPLSLREVAIRSRFREAWRAEAKGDYERAVAWLLRARTLATHTADIDSMVAVDRTTLKLSRARRLAAAGTLRAARDTLAGARGLPADHDLMAEVRALRAELTARLEIERALALARRGDLAAARAAFESVTRMPVDEAIRGYARQRVHDLDRNAATR